MAVDNDKTQLRVRLRQPPDSCGMRGQVLRYHHRPLHGWHVLSCRWCEAEE
jgi:hypothetical protein